MKYLVVFLLCLNAAYGQVNQVDAKGLKQGLWYKNYPGTKIHIYEGVFKDDKPVGIFKYYYESGSIKAIVDNKPNSSLSLVKMYFENEALMSEGCYWNQKKDSIWLNYNEHGEMVSAESYVDDQLNGKRIVYYLNDQLIDGKLTILSICNYVNNVRQGNYKEYFSSGKLKMNGEYLNGEKTGEWIEYYSSGQVMTRVRYKRGLLHGWSYYYDRSGNSISKTMWRDGFQLEGKDLDAFLERCKQKKLDPNQ
ncbi:MAG: toxin-antitoxin system YwqK family antitoxin [Flavobacteriales bacterium]